MGVILKYWEDRLRSYADDLCDVDSLSLGDKDESIRKIRGTIKWLKLKENIILQK